MKAIFVESLNGYLAKGPNDDMSWTPTLDKKIFKLLSFALGGIYFCSKRTFNLLPEVMTTDPNRHFEIVDHHYNNDDWYLASKLFSNAVVLGGPTFLKAVYDKGLIVQTKPGAVPQKKRYLGQYRTKLLDKKAQK